MRLDRHWKKKSTRCTFQTKSHDRKPRSNSRARWSGDIHRFSRWHCEDQTEMVVHVGIAWRQYLRTLPPTINPGIGGDEHVCEYGWMDEKKEG